MCDVTVAKLNKKMFFVYVFSIISVFSLSIVSTLINVPYLLFCFLLLVVGFVTFYSFHCLAVERDLVERINKMTGVKYLV